MKSKKSAACRKSQKWLFRQAEDPSGHAGGIFLCVLCAPRAGPGRPELPKRSGSEVFLHTLSGQRGVGTDGDSELDVVVLAELIEPVQEVLHGQVGGLAGDDLGEAVDEDVGDVVVAGIQAADEALQEVIVLHIVVAGFHQTDLIIDVVGQLGPTLDAHHVAVLILDCGIDEFDHLLGLAGALDPHDHSNHIDHSLHCPPGRSPAYVPMLPFSRRDFNSFTQVQFM